MDVNVIKMVCVINAFAILLLVMLRIGSSWSVYSGSSKRNVLRAMIWLTVSCCIADPIAYAVDGVPGATVTVLLYITNSWLYLANIIVGIFWIRLLEDHLKIDISGKHKMALAAMFWFGVICILVNFFTPIIFDTVNNVYERKSFFWVFLVFAMIYIADGVWLYIKTRRLGGVLKSFPVGMFVTPVLLGIAIQSVFYGISAIWPSVAIGLAAVMTSFQNEKLVIDALTGIYNRFYLDAFEENLEKKGDTSVTGIMIDLNDFKSINDKYGHATGDDALITAARLLTDAVGKVGTTTRYAGDEFVILLNTTDESEAEACVSRIEQAFENFNETTGKPYKLSVSMGYATLDLSSQTLSEFMNIIDKKMYESKKKYHESCE